VSVEADRPLEGMIRRPLIQRDLRSIFMLDWLSD
jgi:hypothetical protein